MASAPIDPRLFADPDASIGTAVRAQLGDRCPWLAVQTSFSALHGTVTPERWATALRALAGGAADPDHDRGSASHPDHGAAVARAAMSSNLALAKDRPPAVPEMRAPQAAEPDHPRRPFAALADIGDLAGLPACLDAWGRRVAVGAVLPLTSVARIGTPPVLLLAPDATAYRRLCRILSWHHEDPAGWEAWVEGASESSPSWDGVVALAQDPSWADRLAWHGAEVIWRLPGSPPPDGRPSAAVPILTDIDGGGARATGLLHLIQERSQVRAHVEAVRGRVTACTLAHLPRFVADLPDAAIEAGHALAARCVYAPGAIVANGQPHWHMPPERCEDPARELRHRCLEGLHQRYGGNTPRGVRERLDYELGVITRKNFASYILAVADITKGRRTCGRGSAASSMACYLLGITNVDPVRYRLVFERFLSDERTDPPDIDVDFPWDERDEVLASVIAEYGHEHVAMIATHQTMRPAGALRDAGRVMGKDREAITAAAKRVDLTARFGVGSGAGTGWGDVMQAANRIEGLLRGYGLHCGGVVITTEPIRDLVPIHPAAKNVEGRPIPAIAWEKDGAEAMGLVKLDLLGNRSLAVVRDVINDLREDGIAIDVWRWAPDADPLTHQMIAAARTIGCFYIESPAMRQLIGKCGRIDFDQLVLLSSIVRPAAFHWIGTYLERLHEFRRTGQHRDEWYPHPALRGLLSESFGILSYQEDVMLSARDLAGFNIAMQNKLRKALGRSDTAQRLASLACAFRDGCLERGVEQRVIDQVWANIVSFAGYSFCKAHSASYAQVSFSCACLKAHNPAHFMARVIHNAGGFYSLSAYVEEARRIGAEILAPCVVRGFPDTRGAGRGAAIRLGLELIKGLHRRTQEAIIHERDRMAFAGVRDLWRRCRPSSTELAALLDAGALDRLLDHRSPAERDWLVAMTVREPRGEVEDHDQIRFDFAPIAAEDPAPPPGLAPLSQRGLDQRAWTILGCLPRAHPFALWELPKRNLNCRDVTAHLAKRSVRLLVWVITRKQVEAVQEKARDGTPLPAPIISPMAFVTLEDETGTLESTWFPQAYHAGGALMEDAQPFWVQGRVVCEYGVPALEVVTAHRMRDE